MVYFTNPLFRDVTNPLDSGDEKNFEQQCVEGATRKSDLES
jgi:hypothetical protein